MSQNLEYHKRKSNESKLEQSSQFLQIYRKVEIQDLGSRLTGVNSQKISQISLSVVFCSTFLYLIMPRKESLAAIVPNRYYDIEATVKYFHNTQKGTTAVIEQDDVQKKIMLPARSIELEEGVQYRFPKCFFSRNGWLKVKESKDISKIERMRSHQIVSLSLEEINEKREELFNNYITTALQVISVGAPQKKQKNGNQLTLTLLKGFCQNSIVDITIWNQEVSKDLENKWVLFEGFRVKMLTKDTFVLVSTVFSKLNILEDHPESEHFQPEKHYPSYSQVYGERTISEMRETLRNLTKCFSVIQAKIIEATVFDYEGCKQCHKKLEGPLCSHCKVQVEKETFWVCQLQVQDESDSCMLYVFNPTLQEMLHYAKKGSLIKGKIRSTIRLDSTGDNNLQSHTLVSIVSITF